MSAPLHHIALGALIWLVLFFYTSVVQAQAPLPAAHLAQREALLPPRARPYLAQVQLSAARHGLPVSFVLAVIEIESRFDKRALSPVGARGLMQLMPGTAKAMGVADPWDVAQNIEGGCKYLAWLKRRYAGDINLILAAYNAGPGLVRRRGGIPSRAVRRYVERGVRAFAKYQRLLEHNIPSSPQLTGAATPDWISTSSRARTRRLLLKTSEEP